MNRARYTVAALVVLSVLGAVWVARRANGPHLDLPHTIGPRAQPDRSKPNVLFIVLDDLNHWVGYIGRNPQSKTPNMDALAKRGVAFTRAYAPSPVCNPVRTAVLSGLRPSTSGVYDNLQDFEAVIPPAATLMTQFRTAGYRVTGSGKVFHRGVNRPDEWDDYDRARSAPADAGEAPDSEFPDYKVADYGIRTLAEKHDAPFFLALGFRKPHYPWLVPKAYYAMYPEEGVDLPPHRDDDLADIPTMGLSWIDVKHEFPAIVRKGMWRRSVRDYMASIAFVDVQVGRVLAALDASPERERTIVVLWGDHGYHFGEKQHWRKSTLWEEATHAPLIWVVPGLTPAGGVSSRTVDFMSIYPTLCDLAGIPVPRHVQGKSIRSLLQDPSAPWSEPAITTYLRGSHAVRTEKWRFIRYWDGEEELYDESKDPFEWKNLADDPGLRDTKQTLAAYLPTTNAPD